MTPAPEKAAPIPAEVLALAERAGERYGMIFPGVTRAHTAQVRQLVKRAIMQALADREARPSRFGCMCQDVEIGSHAVSVSLKAPPHMQDYSANRVAAGLSPDIAVDACLVGEIRRLWSKGIRTYGCCCGHNKVRGWPVEDGKWEWTFYPQSTEARPSLPDSREAQIVEDERDRLYEAHDNIVHGSHVTVDRWFREQGAMLPADRARARQGGNNG